MRFPASRCSRHWRTWTGPTGTSSPPRQGGRKAGPPRFRKKTAAGSARFTTNARFRLRQVNTGKAVLTLPKIGELRVAYSRPLPAAPTSVTLIREADGRYYASFVVDPEPGTAAAPDRVPRTAGLDLGLTDFAAIAYSDGSREKSLRPAGTGRRSANSPAPNGNCPAA